jgi:4-amino-4-deoxy-L-arabinose transferase-like glycosyltransferase
MNTIRRTKGTELAILALIVIACAVPFLKQPFHMDDNFYMDMARNAQISPYFPNDTPYVFQGVAWPDLASHTHPLLQTYFLATILHFFGEGPGREWIYHFFALLYPLMAVLSFYFICARLVSRPLWPAALFACSPLFLVTQHTLMTDVPMLAFWLAAVCCFLYASDQKKSSLYAASALFLTAALFTSYQAFALILLLGFYNLRQKGGRRGWMALAIPPMLIGLWFFINCLHYKRFLFGFTLGYMGTREPFSLHTLGVKLFSVFEYQGWLVVFPFFIFCLFARHLRWRALPLVLLASAFLTQFAVPEYRFIDKCIFLTGFASSFFIVLEMARITWSALVQNRSALDFEPVEEQFLGLWYFGFLFFCLFGMMEGSARYILPMLPPFLLCYCRKLEISEVAEYRLPSQFLNSAMLASGSLVVSLVWGLMLSHADLEFARVYPRAAKDISRIAGPMDSYGGGEWGFRYYLGRAGTKPLPADETMVRGGSFVSFPKLAVPYEISSGLRSILTPIQTFRYNPATPLRILDRMAPAGFYSTGWGLLPFSYAREPLEEVEVFQVNLMAERLPYARVDSRSGIKPWPGFVTIGEQSPLAILAKPDTRIAFQLPVSVAIQLRLLCGVSSDSYLAGNGEAFEFDVRQIDPEGKILAESNVTLHPGIREEDRQWQPIVMALRKTQEGILEFRYSRTGKAADGVGAFSQAVVMPID